MLYAVCLLKYNLKSFEISIITFYLWTTDCTTLAHVVVYQNNAIVCKVRKTFKS